MAPEPPSARRERPDDLSPLRFGAFLALLLGLGLFERLLIPGPPATLALTDSYYYGRLAWLSRLSFPSPVTFDTWTGYPGMQVQWPPGHAWLLAALQALFGAEAPFSPRGLAALAWAGPLLSLAGIALLALLAARSFGRWTALTVAGALLVQPLVADAGQLGEADHHLHEAFFGAATALLLARALRRGAAPLAAGLALGAVAAAPYLFTSSGFLFLPPLAAVLWLSTAARLTPHRWRQAIVLAAACASSLAVVAAGALWLGRLGGADYVRLSGFHVGLHAALLLAASALLLFAPARRLRLAGLAGSLVAAAVLACLGPALAAEGARALRHLGRDSAILSIAEESLPLLGSELTRGLSATLVPAVLALLLAVVLCWRLRRAETWLVPMAGWLALFTAGALAQARFARPLIPIAAVLAGLLVQRLARMPGRPRPRLPGIAARLAAACLLVPPVVVFEPYSDEPARLVEGLAPALAWLRANTPSPGDPLRPDQKPAWAVLADWQLGHLVVALADRPVLASPFGQTPEAEEAARLAQEILRQTSPAEALRLCRERGLRYLLLYEPVPPPPTGEAPMSLRRILASGGRVPGLRPVYVGAPTDLGRVPRIFEVEPAGANDDAPRSGG